MDYRKKIREPTYSNLSNLEDLVGATRRTVGRRSFGSEFGIRTEGMALMLGGAAVTPANERRSSSGGDSEAAGFGVAGLMLREPLFLQFVSSLKKKKCSSVCCLFNGCQRKSLLFVVIFWEGHQNKTCSGLFVWF